ncbi:MAG: glycine dehydrogenase, partial [Candidatus Heimdallarchaeota archaeon]|nr:glycine dehydrogenase [Candidatus Heimdallarchaeota archaeon]
MTEFYESYIGTSQKERQDMLDYLNKSSIDELFSEIPESIYLKEPLTLPGPYSESELSRLFATIASKSKNPSS